MIYLLKSPEARKLENGEYEFFFSLKIGYTDDENTDLKKNKRLNMYFNHHRSIELLYIIPNGTEEQEKKLHYNEWYTYDQSIIDYFKTATIKDLIKLPSNPNNKLKLSEIKDIVSRVISDTSLIDDCVEKLTSDLVFLDEDNVINFLKTSSYVDKIRFENYLKYKSNNYVEDSILNKKIENDISTIEKIKTIPKRLEFIYNKINNKEISEEEYKIIINFLDRKTSDYLITLGLKKIKSCGYNIFDMKKEIEKSMFDKSKLLVYIFGNFKIGEKLSLSTIKTRLSSVYVCAGYSAVPRAIDIKNYFEIKDVMFTELQSDGTKKRVHGYELISKKF